MTQWVLSALDSEAAELKQAWCEGSWDTGVADALALCELRAKAAALRAVNQMTYEGLCEIHGHDPIEE